MEYDKKGNPVTRVKRERRRAQKTQSTRQHADKHRKEVAAGGTEETAETEGQNAELGNTRIPEFVRDIGRRT